MKNNLQNLNGSVVALPTPFNNNGEVDYLSLNNLINFHLANNTNGILVCGTTGETPTLTSDEYSGVIKFTVNKVNGRVPVIAGTGSNSTTQTITTSKLATNLGVDAVLVVGPYYNKPTARGFYQHFANVASNVDVPILLYNVPGRTGSNIPTETVISLANKFQNIIGIKEASGDMNILMDILYRKPVGFKVFSGNDELAYPLMSLGGDGCISVVANQIPAQFSEMLSLARSGKFRASRKIHYQYLNLMNINFIESNPQPVKTALSMMGLLKENFRLPMCTMEDVNRKKIMDIMMELNLITSVKNLNINNNPNHITINVA